MHKHSEIGQYDSMEAQVNVSHIRHSESLGNPGNYLVTVSYIELAITSTSFLDQEPTLALQKKTDVAFQSPDLPLPPLPTMTM